MKIAFIFDSNGLNFGDLGRLRYENIGGLYLIGIFGTCIMACTRMR